jgi:hemerythrin-like domain-containing protein
MEHDRRTALGWVAGAGLTSTLLLSGCGAQAGDEDDEEGEGGPVTANEDLMREHGVLRRILVLYREVSPRLRADPGSIDAAALGVAATFFREFGERYHEQMLDEQHIFPAVRKPSSDDAGLIDTLLAQHERGRAITDYVIARTRNGKLATADAEPMAKALTGFARMYEAHTAREDTVIFPAFRASLGQKAYQEIGEQFEDIERKTFGGDGFDRALNEVSQIEGRLGLADLSGFTAPAPPTTAGGQAVRS